MNWATKNDYELFLRKAFNNVDIKGDPAKVAIADYFVESNLTEIKIGLGYAITIYINNENILFSTEEMKELKTIRESLLNASNLNEVAGLLYKSREIVNSK